MNVETHSGTTAGASGGFRTLASDDVVNKGACVGGASLVVDGGSVRMGSCTAVDIADDRGERGRLRESKVPLLSMPESVKKVIFFL